MSSNLTKIIVVVGPTASGKSDLAINLALKYGGEIISADSRQVYKGLDIGSGKVPRDSVIAKTANRKPPTYFSGGVPHHLLDVASPKRTFTVARYQKLARKALRDILRRGKLPIIVGGTGFYIDALLHDTALPEVKPNPKLRAKLGKLSAPELFKELQIKDPVRAASIERHNPRRLIRALEIIAATGKPVPRLSPASYSNVLKNIGIAGADVLKIGITRPPEELRKRIHMRLLSRMKQGMVAEVKRLHAQGVSWKRLDDLGLEYRYISRYLRELPRLSSRVQARDLLQKMLVELEKEIWWYSKRQITWWRKDKEIKWPES
jgi:tRNA dimethylallyltransferase